jgi:hypothetical protein
MYKLALAAAIGAGALLAVPAPAHAQQSRRASVTCNSYHGHYHSCQLPYRGTARLVQQLSGSACVQGRSWGQRGSSSVWVSRGCRGVFAVRHRYYNDGDQRVGDNGGGYDHGGINDQGGWQRDRNYAVECRSDGQRTTCAWDPRYGNPYLMQRTSGDCVEGRDWGYDSHGQIWVDRSCDARFGYH